jgi:hypothetical protein
MNDKLLKWGLFTIGMVIFTVISDAAVSWLVGADVTANELLGHGELLLVSVGLLLAASGELIVDRLLKGGGGKYHVVL